MGLKHGFHWVVSPYKWSYGTQTCVTQGTVPSGSSSQPSSRINEAAAAWLELLVCAVSEKLMKHDSGWWLQPLWKILVKMGIFPKKGWKQKIFETTTQEEDSFL